MNVLVEACVETLDESVAAERAGAHRLELCANMHVGGTTPSAALIDAVRASVGIPVMAMVRPRGGSFVHSAAEIDQMRRDLDMAIAHGASGVVLGVLDDRGCVAVSTVRELVMRAGETPVTFHKAFDVVDDQLSALDVLVDAGVPRVLTSGGMPTALEGAERLAMLADRGAGRITVIAGGKVRGSNVRAIVDRAGLGEVHARAADSSTIRELIDSLTQATRASG